VAKKTEEQKAETKKATALLNGLSGAQAKQILKILAKKSDIQKLIIKESEKMLKTVDPQEVADDVFTVLNWISQDDFFAECSAQNQFSYQHEVDVAYDMFRTAFEPHCREIDKLHRLGFHEEEFAYVAGAVWGLYRFDYESTTDFYDYVQDEPFSFAEELITEWEKRHPEQPSDSGDSEDSDDSGDPDHSYDPNDSDDAVVLDASNKHDSFSKQTALADFLAEHCPKWDIG